jgi:hypothetical protein
MASDFQGEHPDSAAPTALIALERSVFYGSVPPWPTAMIEPSEAELARWARLWAHPLAPVWIERRQEHLVATLIRAEQRSGRRRRSPRVEIEVNCLRSQLGLAATD